MTEQLALILSAASLGFLAAIFFCVGNTMNSPAKIFLQATPFWDFNEPVASALAAQRAQYVVGAVLLVFSFILQVAAALASPSTHAPLPQWLHTWPYLVLAVLTPSALVAAGFSWLLYKSTTKKVLRLYEERLENKSRQSA